MCGFRQYARKEGKCTRRFTRKKTFFVSDIFINPNLPHWDFQSCFQYMLLWVDSMRYRFVKQQKKKIRRSHFATFLLMMYGSSHYGINHKSIFQCLKISNMFAPLTSHSTTLCQRSCSCIKCTGVAPWHGGYL